MSSNLNDFQRNPNDFNQQWNRLAEQHAFLVEHQEKTTRQIPLVALERVG